MSIVHMDLHPGNILLRDAADMSSAQLSDFFMSQALLAYENSWPGPWGEQQIM